MAEEELVDEAVVDVEVADRVLVYVEVVDKEVLMDVEVVALADWQPRRANVYIFVGLT